MQLAKPKKGPRLADEPRSRTDMVTPELLNHHIVEDADIVHFGDGKEIKPHRVVAKRNKTQRPIDQYHYQHNITGAQYLAAERFYADWYYAGLGPRVTVNLMGVGGGGVNYSTDRQNAARGRHNAALQVLDMYDQGFVIDVVCYEKYLGGGLMKNRIKTRTRFDRLRAALDRLAKYYGVA